MKNSSDLGDTNNVAGFVIFRKNQERNEVLGLRLFGKYDLPKGHVKSNEDPFEAAIREMHEETGYFREDLKILSYDREFFDPVKNKALHFYIAFTEKDPTVSWEHHGYSWIPIIDEKVQKFYDYLKPVVIWAFEKIGGDE